VEIEYRFTDRFTPLKVDGESKVMNKVFHQRSSDGSSQVRKEAKKALRPKK